MFSLWRLGLAISGAYSRKGRMMEGNGKLPVELTLGNLITPIIQQSSEQPQSCPFADSIVPGQPT